MCRTLEHINHCKTTVYGTPQKVKREKKKRENARENDLLKVEKER